MAQEDENKKSGGSEDSSGEMDIIKQAFGSEDPAAGEAADVFSVDLFGGGQDRAGKKKEKAPAQAEQPAKDEKAETDSSGVKVVTDDDLKELFDKSSPAEQQPDQAPPPSPAGPEGPSPAEPAPASEMLGEQPMPEDEVSEIGLDQAMAAEPAQAPSDMEEGWVEDEDEQTSELTDMEVVEQLETRARAGDMTAVGAAKKGERLKKTEELIEELEPVGDDLMQVDELRKLFNNMDVLINWAKEMTARIERMEAELDELKKK